MIQRKSNITPYSEHSNEYKPKDIPEEIQICLNCDLPAKACKFYKCKRYEEKLQEIKARRKHEK